MFSLYYHFLEAVNRRWAIDDATIRAIETNQNATSRDVFDGLADTDAYILESWHPQQQGQPAVLLLAIGDDHCIAPFRDGGGRGNGVTPLSIQFLNSWLQCVVQKVLCLTCQIFIVHTLDYTQCSHCAILSKFCSF